MDILIFDVGLGQCIFFYPREANDYGLMVDCGSTATLNPVDKLIGWRMLRFDSSRQKFLLKDLTLTNYDQDHFSGLPYLRSKVHVETTAFPKNLTGDEIKRLKSTITEPIRQAAEMIDIYLYDVVGFNPPYSKTRFFLNKSDLPGEVIDPNKLSQIVFVSFNGTQICIPGDLTSPAWDKHLLNSTVTALLRGTDIFVASHHGREDGINEKVFNYCKPECVVLSDKYVVHDTQEGMTSKYGNYVKESGIVLDGDQRNLRKTLTTRSDGHIWIRINADKTRVYKTVK